MRIALAVMATLALSMPMVALAEGAVVTVGHNRLEPAEVTISVGDAVTFRNVDAMPGGHSLVAEDGSFESPPLDKDGEWTHTFEKPGTVEYHIREHPSAKGRIVVR